MIAHIITYHPKPSQFITIRLDKEHYDDLDRHRMISGHDDKRGYMLTTDENVSYLKSQHYLMDGIKEHHSIIRFEVES